MATVTSDLLEIRQTFGLSKSELADLMHRRAQSIAEWETRGVQIEMAATVERIRDLARLFSPQSDRDANPGNRAHARCVAERSHHARDAACRRRRPDLTLRTGDDPPRDAPGCLTYARLFDLCEDCRSASGKANCTSIVVAIAHPQRSFAKGHTWQHTT